MQSKLSIFARSILCFLILMAVSSISVPQAFCDEPKLPLPKSLIEFRKTPVDKLAQAFKDASNDDIKTYVRNTITDKTVLSSDWQKLLIVLMETLGETYHDQKTARHELCAEVKQACVERFGENSIESDMGQLMYGISFIPVEEARKAWDVCDKFIGSGRVANSNPDFIVKSLKAYGVCFRDNMYSSDTIHAFTLADQFIATHKVSLPVQADLYNAAVESIYRNSQCFDDNDSALQKFANRAIILNKQLGPKYADQLKNVLKYIDAKTWNEKESAMKTKRFLQRKAAHEKRIKMAKKKR
ncbi:MAG: hypothetical protein SFY67_04230 [Candidatus Melainabacteria bacterium]|nr:hypothetical protein [Candidatus Melainabacteria bacterium]